MPEMRKLKKKTTLTNRCIVDSAFEMLTVMILI